MKNKRALKIIIPLTPGSHSAIYLPIITHLFGNGTRTSPDYPLKPGDELLPCLALRTAPADRLHVGHEGMADAVVDRHLMVDASCLQTRLKSRDLRRRRRPILGAKNAQYGARQLAQDGRITLK
jgi:hypothetical protein